MLIDNKFLYISLPRCGSTSFHYSCIVNGLDVKNLDTRADYENSKIDFSSIDESNIMNFIEHGHTPLIELQNKFGYDLPIIATKRDRYERFYSLYRHIIYDLDRVGLTKLSSEICKLDLNELFFFNTMDIISKRKRYDSIYSFLIKLMPEIEYVKSDRVYQYEKSDRLYEYIKSDRFYQYVINIIDILITPTSHWHNHNKNIIWFDISETDRMEEWVSNITNIEFKLKHVNSSMFIQPKLKLDDEFIERYDSIYEYYDLPKSNKSLL
jgi:hypothetical protein